MKYILWFCCYVFTLGALSQQKFSKEISLTTDNDLYASFNRDRYYTSGLFLTYRHLAKNNNKNLEKRILEWQIGHKMFTPFNAGVQIITQHDRPFAAYLYSSFGVKRVYKKNKILNTSIQIGGVGPIAQGNAVQNAIHVLYGFKKVIGWQYQIKNAFGLNFGAEYIHLLGDKTETTFDASWVNSINIGTVFTNLSSGFKFRFSFIPLQKIINSVAFNTNLNDNSTKHKREVESFFYVKPMLRYALYDATLQGSFLNTSSEVTKELIPIVFDVMFGFKITAKRFNFGYAVNFNTSKSKGLRYAYGNTYGSIMVNYLIR